jgi:hypothetical protein
MLTNAAVKAAAPGARPYKLFDAGGLHLLVRPSGSRTFRMKFQRKGKEQLLTFGQWPDVSLATPGPGATRSATSCAAALT